MKIKQVSLSGFRNLYSQTVIFNPSFNIFIGVNGSGKTNFLEAIYVCLKGKSFRPYSKKEDWVSKVGNSEDKSGINLEIINDRMFTEETQASYSLNNKRWAFFRNGKKTVAQSILGSDTFPVVCFSPDDHELIRGAPESRRFYFDTLFTDVCPGYGETLQRFQKALKNRNQILKSGQEIVSLRTGLSAELSAWTETLAEEATNLWALRRELWENLRFRIEKTEKFLSLSDRCGTLNVNWETDLGIAFEENFPSLTSNRVYDHIMARIDADWATGWTHRGPQRDDLILNISNLSAKNHASQGQARLLALLLRWVHIDWISEARNQQPILFLDDFSSELDPDVRTHLLSLIFSRKSQVFLTSTDLQGVDLSRVSDYTYYRVQAGKILSENLLFFDRDK